MKLMSIFRNFVAFFAAATLTVACSSDDSPTPPPMVDCNVTGPAITLTPTSTSGCGLDDGEVAVAITGGTGTLTVSITPQPVGVAFANNTFTAVEPGDYTVDVVDADNCSTSAAVTVGFPAGGLSYANDIDALIQNRCAIAGCHGAGEAQPDFTDFATFQTRALNLGATGVRQRVKTDDMPRSGGALTAAEKEALFCWIDEGALNN